MQSNAIDASAPVRRFRVLLGCTMLAQSRLWHGTLDAALPSCSHALSLRFGHHGASTAPLVGEDVHSWLCAMLAGSAAVLIVMPTATQSASAVALCCTCYALLLEASVYQNHHYLTCSLLICFAVVPRSHSRTLLALLRFTTCVPYAYGALAKLNTDWLIRLQPTTRWCEHEIPAALPHWASALLLTRVPPRACGAMLSWGGVLVDATHVPLMAWPLASGRQRTRRAATCLAACFHSLNAICFHLGIFPPLMLSALVLWCEDDRPATAQQPTTIAPGGAKVDAPSRTHRSVVVTCETRPKAAGAPPSAAQPRRRRQHSSSPERRQPAASPIEPLPSASSAPSPQALQSLHAPHAPQPLQAPQSPQAPRSPSLLGPPSWLRAFCWGYVLWHLLVPLRRYAILATADPLEATWSGEGYLGAWLMKLHQTDGLAILTIQRNTSTCCASALGAPPMPTHMPSHAPPPSKLTLMPQLDPWLTAHQRRFVDVRPAALLQYARHRAHLLDVAWRATGATETASKHGTSPCTCLPRVEVASCFSQNMRRPRPLYNPSADLASVERYAASAVGDWIRPLGGRDHASEGFCAELLRQPPQFLRAAAEGFEALHHLAQVAGRVHDLSAAPIPEERLTASHAAWFWRQVGRLHSIEAAASSQQD